MKMQTDNNSLLQRSLHSAILSVFNCRRVRCSRGVSLDVQQCCLQVRSTMVQYLHIL